MTNISFTEENYLKAIFTLAESSAKKISNLSIAELLSINPATVTEMLRKLQEKQLIDYERLTGAKLTKKGKELALKVIRKHRLWETFLVEKLHFSWDEVHDVAEQLEHIHSDKLINSLDEFLNFPKFDPHGDPIPDQYGKFPPIKAVLLADAVKNKQYFVARVADTTNSFLQFLDTTGLSLNDTVEVKEIRGFDQSMEVLLNGKHSTIFSAEVAKRLLVIAKT